MTFPQPSSTEPLLNGQQFFRLQTELSSAGDLYESEVGALGFAMGPNSDVSNIKVSRFDSNESGGVSSFTLSPDRNFVGRIDALPTAQYIKSRTRKGRILISTDDIYSSNWRPAGFSSNRDIYAIQPPLLDVMQYFMLEPSITPQRSDRTFRYQYFVPTAGGAAGDGISYFAFPTYGRKSGYITLLNLTAPASLRVGLQSVRFVLSTNTAGTSYLGTEGLISAAAPVFRGDTRNIVFDARTHGLWDYMLLILGGSNGAGYDGGPVPTVITLSDDY